MNTKPNYYNVDTRDDTTEFSRPRSPAINSIFVDKNLGCPSDTKDRKNAIATANEYTLENCFGYDESRKLRKGNDGEIFKEENTQVVKFDYVHDNDNSLVKNPTTD